MVIFQSEEDLALKQKLDLYVERLQDTDSGVQKLALESMRYGLAFISNINVQDSFWKVRSMTSCDGLMYEIALESWRYAFLFILMVNGLDNWSFIVSLPFLLMSVL